MVNISETNSSSYDWVNGKVKAVETTDLVCPEVANVAPTELALRTANLNGRTINLEAWKNTLTNADADSIVNTYEEMKSFFASVPEGATLPTELAKRVDRSESLTTTFSGAITGTYNNNNETLLKFIDVVHTTQQTSFTLTLQNANNCNLDLRLKFFTNLILNVAVIMADGTTIAAGTNIPVLSTVNNVLLNISGWGGNYYVVFETVNNTLTGTRGYVGLSEAQGKELNDNKAKKQVVLLKALITSDGTLQFYKTWNNSTISVARVSLGKYSITVPTGLGVSEEAQVLLSGHDNYLMWNCPRMYPYTSVLYMSANDRFGSFSDGHFHIVVIGLIN